MFLKVTIHVANHMDKMNILDTFKYITNSSSLQVTTEFKIVTHYIPGLSKDRSYRRPTFEMIISFCTTGNGCHTQTHHWKSFSTYQASSLRAGFNRL